MNDESLNQLPEELSGRIADAFRVPQTAQVAKRVIADRLKELVAEEKLMTLTDEECQLLAEFRRFKATTKPGGVFKWQTTPITTVVLETEDTGLIHHPQNLSV